MKPSVTYTRSAIGYVRVRVCWWRALVEIGRRFF